MSKKSGLIGGALGLIALAAIGSTLVNGTEPDKTQPAVAASAKPDITVYKDPNCGCCKAWGEYLEDNGFQVHVVAASNMSEIKRQYGVPREVQSCHTAVIDGRVIEGHVPADDIKAYLAKPAFNTKGLAVPGMVQGSPGMETGRNDDYAVITFSENGQESVYREHKDY
ncbi:MAG: DUF411 domain-containing protein [Marinobacter sp.]|nr:DUF411 domain-containing protein [Marinobacter sp.]